MPVRVVCACIRRGTTVLVARRGPLMEHAGTWEFPGGKVEMGEDDREALAREIAEELGCRVTVGALAGEGITGRIHLVGYWCEAKEEPVATEHDRLEWAELHALGGFRWAPADGPIIAAIQSAGLYSTTG
ncbi:MAG: (deoxy)nucleoside triphosphate pyrophosphohydrolase [Deltaproteobacteria bacterium]|nr:(deoxy)nucleoside triphosphate pyrophosphohydrolase [Deltaproteobacteria bacterium]